jgi:hypothetical protein
LAAQLQLIQIFLTGIAPGVAEVNAGNYRHVVPDINTSVEGHAVP